MRHSNVQWVQEDYKKLEIWLSRLDEVTFQPLVIQRSWFEDDWNIIFTDASLTMLSGIIICGDAATVFSEKVPDGLADEIIGDNKILLYEAL